MIDKRRNPKPPRASSKTTSPASSGPRWVITSRIDTSSSRPTLPRAAPYSQTPQMPHILDCRLPIADCQILLRYILEQLRHNVIAFAGSIVDLKRLFVLLKLFDRASIKARVTIEQTLLRFSDRLTVRNVHCF